MSRQSPAVFEHHVPLTRWRRLRGAVAMGAVINGWIGAMVGGAGAVLGAYALQGTPADATTEFLRQGGWWAVARATLALLPLTVGGQIALATWRAWRKPSSDS